MIRRRSRTEPDRTPTTDEVVEMMDELNGILEEAKRLLARVQNKWGHPNA